MHCRFALTLLPVFSFIRVAPSHLPLTISIYLSPFSSASQVPVGLQLVAMPTPVAPPFSCAGFQVTVAGRGVGSTPTLPHAPPLWPCREEAPGGGLLRREAAGGAAAALTSPSRYQLSAGPPLRCRWRGGALGSTPSLPHAPPLWPCRDSGGREGGSTAAWQSHCSKGEYWDGLGLSRSLAMQQRQLMGPVVAASAVGSTGGGEGCGVNTDAPSRPSPLAVQGGGTWRGGLLRREAAPGGDWREAAVHHGNPAASRESIGVGLALQGTHGDGRAAALQQLAVGAMRESIGVGWPLKAEGGSTGARAGEWSPPSHSPPPLSRLPSLPAAPCLDHRGVSPSPNPLLFPLPSSLSIMALCTAVVGTGKGMGVKCGLGGWGAWEQVGSSLP
ncbi:unnamed protein product [Closterium sp. NIES-65]|nr:unnamed protein product [Closterium sp. NIES-65]